VVAVVALAPDHGAVLRSFSAALTLKKAFPLFERCLFLYLETGLCDDYSANRADVAVDVPFPQRDVVPRLQLEKYRILLELVVLLERQFLQSRRRNEELFFHERLCRLQRICCCQRVAFRSIRAATAELEVILAQLCKNISSLQSWKFN